jgi:3-oxoacyl-[acyl-carrier protein] reductase
MIRRIVVLGMGASLVRPLLENPFKEDEITLLGREYTTTDLPNPIDVLITVPGKTHDAKIDGMTFHQWDRSLEDNLSSVGKLFLKCGHRMRNGGNVVVVGSVVGSAGAYGAANYAAAKAGLVGLVRSAALEWAARGVCVNLLELGFTELGMGARLPEKVKARVLPTIPLGRFGTAADFVHAVEFLSATRYMTGGVLTLAGGLR